VAACGATIFFVPGNMPALTIMSAALFGHQAWSSNIHTAISEISPPAHVAVLYGITGAAGTMLGAVAQLAIGPVVDSCGYQPVFVAAGLAYTLAAVLLFSAGKIEPIIRPSPVGLPDSGPLLSGNSGTGLQSRRSSQETDRGY